MNRRLLALAATAALAAAATLTGCGTTTGTSSQPPKVSVAPTNPSPSASQSAPGGTVAKQAISKPVTVTGGGRTVQVDAIGGGCKTVRLVDQESAADVTLTVEVTTHHKPGQMCPDIAKDIKVSATLKAPVDSRKVLDGSTGKQLQTHS